MTFHGFKWLVQCMYECENGQNKHTTAPPLPLPLLPCTMSNDKYSTYVISHTQLIFKWMRSMTLFNRDLEKRKASQSKSVKTIKWQWNFDCFEYEVKIRRIFGLHKKTKCIENANDIIN